MALNIYIAFKFNGTDILGSPTIQQVGGEDVSEHVEVFSLYHEIGIEGDRTSSRLVHQPITIVKPQDRASPLFLTACDQNAAVEATIKYFAPQPGSSQGVKVQEQTLTGGRIVSVRTEMLNNRYPENASLPVLERISISYAQLITTNLLFNSQSQLNVNTARSA